MEGCTQSNENIKMAISVTASELAPLIKASQNHMPVENLLTYTNDIGISGRILDSIIVFIEVYTY